MSAREERSPWDEATELQYVVVLLAREVGALRAEELADRVRAEVLREAADLIEAEQHRLDDAENARFGCLDHESELQHTAVHAMGAMLRRVASGSQPDAGDTTQPAPDYRAAVTEALRLLETAPEAFQAAPSQNIGAAAHILRTALNHAHKDHA
jgi:hypothetical protein